MNGDRVIGGYALRRLLGRGGMGEVHLAVTPTGGLAAVKLIAPALARDPAFRRRFEREVAAARRVARFCTAAVLDAGIDGDVAYLVTEYVKGPDLAQAVRDQGPFSGGNLEALAVGIATALSAIHGAGVVHRDLKPSNVLLSPLGPRVIDFGIAQLVDQQSLVSQGVLGTPAYMAPEQVRGEVVTGAADVFAWGGVIAFAGTGRAPFGGGAPGEVLYRITMEEPRLDGLDDGIRGIVARALAKDARLRPSAQELLGELVGGTRLAAATEVVERTWTGATPPAPLPTPPPAGHPATGPGRGDAPVTSGAARGDALGASEVSRGGGHVPSGAGRGDGPPGAGAAGGRRRRWPWTAGAVAAAAMATAVALVVVPGLTAPAWPYEAGFGDGWATGTSAGGTARPSGAGYELTVNPGWRLWKTAPRREPDDAATVITATAALIEGSGAYGVWCHGSSSSGDRYDLVVDGSGAASIVKRRAGTDGTTLYGPRKTAAPAAGANRLVAECAGGGGGTAKVTLRLWFNDRLVAEASDADAPYGPAEAGTVAAADAGARSRVRFDTFVLRPKT
ncbi:serine/threonine protein kinase [Actinomadura sp. ATCC 31491]|uniref:Serine/threonine protein kinase n=1 Tax=Actinomadura luzonensis TaxID=2805427 RepID=A0ABT0G8Y5_9ACTN|nr:serine/threonine-protein kinase [Actinomadura luzonensis]MCK2221057.1 serine/threonine protein kinase [Actinomadura luzonensis]